MRAIALPGPRERAYLPNEYKVTVWSRLKPYFNDLLKRPIESTSDLERWILDKSELDAIVNETFSWRFIDISRNSNDEKAMELYEYTVEELGPRITRFEHLLNERLINSPFLKKLNKDKYFTYLREINNIIELYHEENIPLYTEIQLRQQEYGKLFSHISITTDGRQMTLQKASSMLEEPNRVHREKIFWNISRRISEDADRFEMLFDSLLKKRHQMALNAGFENFRDYKFKALGRFDYKVEDCLNFHNSISCEILPILDELYKIRKSELGVDQLRPWDLHVDYNGENPLRPFKNINDLVKKSRKCLNRIDPSFGEIIGIMKGMGHLDLNSRKAKRPGGFNMPLHLTGVPFLFMNATNTLGDMRTFMHESGHSIHSFFTRDYKLRTEKKVPVEVAELAAMTMELLSMEHWDVFFEKEEDLKRAKFTQLESVLKNLPWIATIDKFQHWIYTHPQHSQNERKDKWLEILYDFSSDTVDYDGLDTHSQHLWYKQLHLFEVPFYYIEYGLAQLGAIAIWKQYKEAPEKAIKNYINALKLGYTKPIKEIYKEAGITFDFSPAYVRELGDFIKQELMKLIQGQKAVAA